jgi:hypothetical protein
VKRCSKCDTEKPLTEFSLFKGVPRSHCKLCKATTSAAWRAANPERNRQVQKDWYALNGQRVQTKNAAWRAANPEKAKANQERATERWRKDNGHKVNAKQARRTATQLQATPAWADGKAIEQYYLIARYLSVELGSPFSVDHVVPLRSKEVCGLHAHTNLSILPQAWNAKKGNRTWPEKA